MITSLYPIIGTRDIRHHVDAANLLEKFWRDAVRRNVERKARRHQLPLKFTVVK